MKSVSPTLLLLHFFVIYLVGIHEITDGSYSTIFLISSSGEKWPEIEGMTQNIPHHPN